MVQANRILLCLNELSHTLHVFLTLAKHYHLFTTILNPPEKLSLTRLLSCKYNLMTNVLIAFSRLSY
jgi:hypothetical protein